jgi:hypothetical protein
MAGDQARRLVRRMTTTRTAGAHSAAALIMTVAGQV